MRIGGVRSFVALSLVSVVVLAVCGAPAGSGGSTPRSSAFAAPSPSDTPQTAGRTGAAATGNATPATRAAFLSYSFTDVRDGKSFTLSDFPGKQVFVLGMAVW